jgi:MoaA/NifB/PqqE/SkfB family radical SAM enzyme
MPKLISSLKKKASMQLADLFFQLGGQFSNQALLRILDLFSMTIHDRGYQEGFKYIRFLIKDDHGCVSAARRLIRELNPQVRKKIIENFFIGSILEGYQKRYQFWQEYGFAPPVSILMSPTQRCNLNCTGCFAAEYERTPSLSIEIMEKIIKEAKSIGTYQITLLGGEPLLRIQELLTLFKNHPDIAFQIFTNGLLLNQDIALALAGLGNVAISLSLEGFQPETDARRGSGSFAAVLQAMDFLKKAGILFSFSVTVTRQNLGVVTSDEFMKNMILKGCIYGWYFLYLPVGGCPTTSSMLTPNERRILRDRIINLRRKYPILLVDFWHDGKITHGCMAGGRKYLHINANGDVEPCVFTHFAVDNINEKSLIEVLQSPFFEDIRRRLGEEKNLLRPCMIIDKPDILRETVKKYQAYPTSARAFTLLEEFKEHLDTYSSAYKKIADELWYGPEQ